MFERHFFIIALFLSVGALIYPPAFVWGKIIIPYLLGVIMFGMGLTLETSDFVNVLKKWKLVLLGIAAQYSIMPLLSLIFSYMLNLPYDIFIGMVILGACPGGTASNVITYLSRGNLALSVTMTFFSTLIAPFVTPGIIYLFLGTMVDIELWAMMKSVFWIVVFPLVDGLILRRFLRDRIEPLLSIFPSISIIAISFVIAIIMGLNKETIMTFPVIVFLAVILHNILGLTIGYRLGRLFSRQEKDCRTVAIEVGMQNSGLGVSLAASFFSSQSALPSALFSLWHNLSGISLAKYWSNKSMED